MLSPGVLSILYNTLMGDNDMNETRFLFQPRGPGTAWLFRMATPAILIGRINPRTGKPYKGEIRESLGGVKDLTKARELRDLRLGEIRKEEQQVIAEADGSMETALEIAADLRSVDDDDERDVITSALVDHAEALEQKMAKRLEKKHGRAAAKKIAAQRAVRWYKTAYGERTPFDAAVKQYKTDKGKTLSRSTLNNLDTAAKEFMEYAGADVCLQDVDRRMVAGFVTEFLPSKKGPKAPEGQGPATIRKKVSMLGQVWRWTIQRGLLPYSRETPWDDQAPSIKEVRAAAVARRPFEPEETRKLFAAAHVGTALGDVCRVTLLCGVRLEEIASLDAAQVAKDARYYTIKEGKTVNAARIVPLIGVARDLIRKRLTKVNGAGPLFPEVPVRKSTGKRGGALSQAFTTLRRKELGKHTDRELAQHCFRHTWRTAARRAGVDLRTTHERGGWSRGKDTDVVYDAGLQLEQYERDQKKVVRWLKDRGYIA